MAHNLTTTHPQCTFCFPETIGRIECRMPFAKYTDCLDWINVKIQFKYKKNCYFHSIVSCGGIITVFCLFYMCILLKIEPNRSSGHQFETEAKTSVQHQLFLEIGVWNPYTDKNQDKNNIKNKQIQLKIMLESRWNRRKWTTQLVFLQWRWLWDIRLTKER